MSKRDHIHVRKKRRTNRRFGKYHLPAAAYGLFMAMVLTAYGHQGAYLLSFDDDIFLAVSGIYIGMSILMVRCVEFVTHKLDKSTPWSKYSLVRTVKQLLMGIAAPTVCFLVLYNVIGKILPSELANSSYFHSDIFVVALLLLILNMWYFISRVLKDIDRLKGVFARSERWRRQAILENFRTNDHIRSIEKQYKADKTGWTIRYEEAQLHAGKLQDHCDELNKQLNQKTVELGFLRDEIRNSDRPSDVDTVPSETVIVVKNENLRKGYKPEEVALLDVTGDVVTLHLLNGHQEIMSKVDSLRKALELFPHDLCKRVSRTKAVAWHAVEIARYNQSKELSLVLKDERATEIKVYKDPKLKRPVEQWLLEKGIEIQLVKGKGAQRVKSNSMHEASAATPREEVAE